MYKDFIAYKKWCKKWGLRPSHYATLKRYMQALKK